MAKHVAGMDEGTLTGRRKDEEGSSCFREDRETPEGSRKKFFLPHVVSLMLTEISSR
jgi:hypothetical protein